LHQKPFDRWRDWVNNSFTLLLGRVRPASEAVALDRPVLDLEQTVAQLRASIRKARVPDGRIAPRAADSAGPVSELDGAVEHDLVVLRSNYDVANAPFTSHRPLLGRLIIFFRDIARELLLQLLLRQSSYNAAAARALSRLTLKVDEIVREQDRIARRLNALEAEVAAGAPRAAKPINGGANATKDQNGFDAEGLNDRIDAIEEALGQPRRGLR
jgi:hypothetical protein